MKALKRILVPVLLLTAGCGEGNRLIGTWSGGPEGSCGRDRITFTPENVISRYSPSSAFAGQEFTVPVTYRVDGPNRITAVNRDGAGAETYVLSDDDHMAFGSDSRCRFERVE